MIAERFMTVGSALFSRDPEVALNARVRPSDVRATVWACVHDEHCITRFKLYLRFVSLRSKCSGERAVDVAGLCILSVAKQKLTSSGFGHRCPSGVVS